MRHAFLALLLLAGCARTPAPVPQPRYVLGEGYRLGGLWSYPRESLDLDESGIAATADALGLHRNTVSTRIIRAQELLGLDLGDPETRLAVQLACRTVRR